MAGHQLILANAGLGVGNRAETRTFDTILAPIVANAVANGYTYTAMSPDLTFSLGAPNAGPTLAGTVLRETESVFAYGGGSPAAAGAVFPDTQFYRIYNLTFTDASRSGLGGSVTFDADCTELEVRVKGNGLNSQFRIVVDNQYSSYSPQAPSDGNVYHVKVTFPSKQLRTIRIESSKDLFFGGIALDATGTANATSNPSAYKLIILGDSFTEGTGADNTQSSYGAQIAHSMAIKDVSLSGFGGTGWIRTFDPGFGSVRDDIEGRIDTDCYDNEPNLIIIAAGLNDEDEASMATNLPIAVSNTLSAIQSNLGSTAITYVVGPWNPSAPSLTGNRLTVRNLLRDTTLSHPYARYLDPTSVVFSKADPTHPDQDGHDTLAAWFIDQIGAS